MCNVELNKTDRLSTWVEGDLSQYSEIRKVLYSEIRNACPGTPRFDAVDYQSRTIHLSFPVITPRSPSRREDNIRLCAARTAVCFSSFFCTCGFLSGNFASFLLDGYDWHARYLRYRKRKWQRSSSYLSKITSKKTSATSHHVPLHW